MVGIFEKVESKPAKAGEVEREFLYYFHLVFSIIIWEKKFNPFSCLRMQTNGGTIVDREAAS